MMKIKKNVTKIAAILLSALLLVAIAIPFATAESNLLAGQKELYVKNVSTPPVQDGIINGHKVSGVTVDEYGSGGPTFCLSPEDYRAIDLEGNPLDVELPSYIYMYMAKDADALYLAMEIQEDPHAGDKYEFTTFLGFGDGSDADTMNSGAFTTFKMDNGNSPRNDPGTWMDTQVTALSAQKVAADGTVTETTANRKFSNPVEYTLPAWASETTSTGKNVTVFEAELDFEDAKLGSGLEAGTSLPERAYFAFELGVFNGTEKIGKIVFNSDLTGKADAPDGEIKTVPHVINLKTEFNASTASNANLSTLSVEGGTLSPAFAASETNYALKLPYGTTSAKVSAITEASETVVTVAGADAIDGVTAGGNETITITCVAQNGYTKVYTLNVEWTYDNTDYYVDAAAGNDTTGSGSSTAPFATIEKAMQAIVAKEWKINDEVTIHINGTFNPTAPNGVLFGAKTVFTKEGYRLPITIKGDSKTGDVINAFVGKSACANSYHFDNLTFNIDGVSGAYLYAGSGQIKFTNTNWTTKSALSALSTVFYADTFTAKVFEGWTATEIAKAKSQNKNGNIETSFTVGSSASYWIAGSSGYYLAAIGDTDGWDATDGIAVKSSEVEVSAILDNAWISKMCIHPEGLANGQTVTTTKYAKANIFMDGANAAVHQIGADKNTEGRLIVNAEVEIGVFGGKSIGTNSAQTSSSSYIRGGRNDTINGNLTITVESGAWQYVQGGLGSMYVNGNYEINFGGTAYINRDGTYVDSTTGKTVEYGEGFYGSCGNSTITNPITGTITHNIYGGYIKNYYGIHGSSTFTTNNVVHNVTGGKIDYYYGGGDSKSTNVKTKLINNISGGTITNFNGTGKKDVGMNIAEVVNNISGSATIATYNGTYHGTVTIARNNISGGTITGTYNGTYNSLTKETHTTVSGGEIKSTFYVSYFAKNSSDLVKNTITGGIFNSTCLMGGYGGNIGKVENYISGGTFQGKNYVYLGPGSTTWPSVVGNVENNISDGKFGVRVIAGGQSTNVTGNVTNNITGGDFTEFYGGVNQGYYSTTTKNMIGATANGTTAATNSPYCQKGVEGKVINTFGKEGEAGPTFGSPCFGGDLAANRALLTNTTVENTVISGKWNSNFYGGGDNSNASCASVTNTFKGGTFGKIVICGSYNAKIVNLTNNVEGGTFKGYFFGGSRRANITGNVINNVKGGTFNSLFFGGSDQNSSSANAMIADADNGKVAPTTYTISGSIKNTFTGGTFMTGASGAGFGTIEGNVENTLKGSPDFKLGYYGVQATLMDTTVNGNVLNLITKDENGVAPTFPAKNAHIEYTFDNTNHTYVYNTDGSNIGFAATGASGTVYKDASSKENSNKAPESDSTFTKVNGYVETIIEAGHFDGHYYAGGGLEVYGENEDGYAVINIVKGDPVFDYVWAGGCISSNRGKAYKTYNEIQGGTYNKTFSSFNRTATSGSHTNAMEVVTLIKGGTFNNVVTLSAPWTDGHSNQHQRTAPYTLTIEGGTFNGDVYGLSTRNTAHVGPYLLEGGDITINVNGGTFNKGIYGTSIIYTASKYDPDTYATINIAPTKGDVIILGDIASRFANEKIALGGGDYKLILGADASIAATGATGDVKIAQDGTWKKQVYVTMPAGNDAKVTVTGTHCFDREGSSVTAVKGGVQMFGATMLLTDRIAVRALFDKASVDQASDFTFSFDMGNKNLASGSKADLTEYNDDYYCIVLAKIGANDFTKSVAFSGSDMVWGTEFSIESLSIAAQTAWAGNETSMNLAKAIQNFATIVATPTATLPHDLTPAAVDYKATASRDEGTSFIVTGKGLVMGNAVGIRIYGTSTAALSAESVTIKVNGTDVSAKAVISAGASENEYYIDLYVNAKNMSDELTIEIIEKESGKTCLKLTDRVDAIAASYTEEIHGKESYDKAQQLLVYIQAAVAYANA